MVPSSSIRLESQSAGEGSFTGQGGGGAGSDDFTEPSSSNDDDEIVSSTRWRPPQTGNLNKDCIAERARNRSSIRSTSVSRCFLVTPSKVP